MSINNNSDNNSDNSNNLPLIEKYRPNQVNNIIGHEYIINTLNNYVKKEVYPHVLFYGPPGTGKTSTILVYANQLYGNSKSRMIMHLNASDERGIDIIRNRIKEFINTQSIFISNKPKLVILDEADAMTEDAQFSLRELVINSKSTFFCVICNYINKIHTTLQSRFIKYYFKPLEKKVVIDKLIEISNKENISYTQNGIEELYKLSQGDMRKCLNLLQSATHSNISINENYIYQLFGKIKLDKIHRLISILFNGDFNQCIDEINNILNEGISYITILNYIGEIINDYSIPPIIISQIGLELSNIEYNCSLNTNQYIQINGLISLFFYYRNQI